MSNVDIVADRVRECLESHPEYKGKDCPWKVDSTDHNTSQLVYTVDLVHANPSQLENQRASSTDTITYEKRSVHVETFLGSLIRIYAHTPLIHDSALNRPKPLCSLDFSHVMSYASCRSAAQNILSIALTSAITFLMIEGFQAGKEPGIIGLLRASLLSLGPDFHHIISSEFTIRTILFVFAFHLVRMAIGFNFLDFDKSFNESLDISKSRKLLADRILRFLLFSCSLLLPILLRNNLTIWFYGCWIVVAFAPIAYLVVFREDLIHDQQWKSNWLILASDVAFVIFSVGLHILVWKKFFNKIYLYSALTTCLSIYIVILLLELAFCYRQSILTACRRLWVYFSESALR